MPSAGEHGFERGLFSKNFFSVSDEGIKENPIKMKDRHTHTKNGRKEEIIRKR